MGFTAPSGHDMIRKTVLKRGNPMAEVRKNTVHPLHIEGYTAEGMGVARLDGRVVFIPGTIRGEDWEVQLLKVNKGVAWGKGTRLISPSPVRQEPDCPYSGRCGGCSTATCPMRRSWRPRASGCGTPWSGWAASIWNCLRCWGRSPPALPQQGAVPCLPRKVRAVHRLLPPQEP